MKNRSVCPEAVAEPESWKIAWLLAVTCGGLLFAQASGAGQAENISSCVNKAKQYAGIALNEFDATYAGNVFSLSAVRWPNAYCEVKVGAIFSLTVNEKNYIYKGYSGKASYDLYQMLDAKTDTAISQLESRIALLKERLKTVDAELSKPRPDQQKWSNYIDEGISQSLGRSAGAAVGPAPHVGSVVPRVGPVPVVKSTGVAPDVVSPPKGSEGGAIDRSSQAAAARPRPAPEESNGRLLAGGVNEKSAGTSVVKSQLDAPNAAKLGVNYVKVDVLEMHLAPSKGAPVTNRIYRRQMVEVLELKGEWARVSPYYDGSVEGAKGQVARWILATGLSLSRPKELDQPRTVNDPRIDKDAIPKVGEGGLSANDVQILNKGALKFLNSGKCSRVEFADKSVNKANTYYVNCGGQNLFFTPADI